MIKKITLVLSITIVLLSMSTQAQWSNNPNVNNAICTAIGNQQIPEIISDGNGGAIITWQDYRNGTTDIYAQRISSSGVILWATDGVSICSAPNGQYGPTIVSDGFGGAIITWGDRRNNPAYNAPLQLYSQRINSSGVVQWTLDGVAICTVGNISYTNIITDSLGGAIITWADNRNGIDYNIYAQRINSLGIAQWSTNGLAVSTSTNNEYPFSIINDGSGGAIITWSDYYDFYTQKINSTGTIQWNPNPILISTGTLSTFIKIIPDGFGGAIIGKYKNNYPNAGDLSIQRINNGGNILWNSSGIHTNVTLVSDMNMIPDKLGGVIFAWNNSNINNSIYIQRVNNLGIEQWQANGVNICNSHDPYYNHNLISDGAGGAIIVWPDNRNADMDLYAQKIDSLGTVIWINNGVAISTAITNQEISKTISDGAGGLITTWIDKRVDNTVYDVYAQKIYSNGTTVDINEIVSDHNSIRIFPNPNNGIFTVESKKEGKYSIINDIGQTIQVFKLDGLNYYTQNIEHLSNGVYFIVGVNDHQITNQKIVVIN